MSGPWDRQPSPEPDDEWPSEDLGRRDPWSTGGSSRDVARDAAPGWDDWPAPPPPADDYLIEEPLRPSSDPWAESWTDDATSGPAPTWSGERGEPAAPRVEPWYPDADPWGLPPADTSWREPSAETPPAPSPDEASEPREASSAEPAGVEPPSAEAELEEIPVEAGAPQAPQVAWSPPEPDAWSAADEIETDTNEALPDEPDETEVAESPGWAGEPPSIFRSPEPEPEPSARTRWFAPAETTADAVDAEWRETIFPTGEPEAEAAEPEDEQGVVADGAAVAPADLDAAPTPAEAAPDLGERDAFGERESELMPEADQAAEAESEPELEPEPEAEPEPAAASRFNPLRWLSRGAPKAEPEALAATPQPEVQAPEAEPAEAEPAEEEPAEPIRTAPAGEDEAEPEPVAAAEAVAPDAWEPDATLDWQPAAGHEAEQAGEPPIPDDDQWAEPWPEADVAAVAGAGEAPEPTISSPDETEAQEAQPPSAAEDLEPPSWPEPAWRASVADGWRTQPSAPDAAEVAEPQGAEPVPEPELIEPGPEPEVIEPEPEPSWRSEPTWPEASESTQVLPSTWAPSVPEPRPAEPSLAPSAGEIRTRLAAPDADEDAEPATSTAEQAVPWLIGVILLLAGMVIVLLALIFAGDASLAGAQPDPSATQVAVVGATDSLEPTPTPAATPVATPSAAPSVSTAPTPTPVAVPDYGPLEMVYQGRSAALAAIYLLHRDFTTEEEPEVLAQDAEFDVRRFAWSPDGRHGAGLLADVLVSIEPGAEKRRLGDGISTITFGSDPATLYAVRVTQDGANDVASILAIDFASGDSSELASVTYTRPSLESEAAVNEAQFADDGGPVRLYWMHDGSLRLWALGAGAWDIDPESGEVTEAASQDVPWLWDDEGRHRVAASVSSGTTTLQLLGRTGEEQATTIVEGLVSHLRWSPDGKRVVFTLGRSTPNGGVLQDLFLWDQADCQEPCQLTNTGAAFGAQWLGTMDRFQEAAPDA